MVDKKDPRVSSSLLRRAIAFAIICVVAFVPSVVALMRLQLVEGEANLELSEKKKTKTLPLKGMRGSITDVNGQLLAYDRKSYDIQFYRDPSHKREVDRKAYTQVIIRAIEIIEKNGGTVVDDFSLVKNPDATFSLVFMDGGDETIRAKQEEQWRQNLYISDVEKYPVEKLYDRFRQYFFIPDDMIWVQARKVLAVWQGVQMTAFLVDQPFTIARDVSFETVAQISALQAELTGMSVSEGSMRVYPRGELAGKIVGYTNRIFSNQGEEYKSMGYSLSTDFVGQAGIEKSMEEELSGNIGYRQGAREVEFNRNGAVTREISRTEPTDGNSIALTLDIDLQQKCEEAIQQGLPQIRVQQEYLLRHPENYDRKKQYEAWLETHDRIRVAESGTAIVLDVNTGKVLAMADWPSYDPSEFATGISTERYKELVEDERAPLFNKAISTRDIPGSIFKMVTGIAGVMENKMGLYEEINCKGKYDKYVIMGPAPRCWTKYPEYNHPSQNLERAIKNSCNYYFFTVSDRLGIETLERWGGLFGLTRSTNIELPNEATSQIGTQKVLFDPDVPLNQQKTYNPLLYANEIRNILVSAAGKVGIKYPPERLDSIVDKIMQQAFTGGETQIVLGIRKVLNDESGMTAAYITNNSLSSRMYQQLRNLLWTPYHTIMTGIGQSITQVTPIAVARYVAAVANGGTVYDAQIVESVTKPNGEIAVKKMPVGNKVPDISGVIPSVFEGMREVVSGEDGGTAASEFVNWEYTKMIAGKTGTAQRNIIDIENNAWFVAFAPVNDPEIAVVVYVPYGYAGAKASKIFKPILEYWMERENREAGVAVNEPNALVP